MLLLFLVAVASVGAFVAWRRVGRLEDEIARLSARIRALEARPDTGGHVPRQAPAVASPATTPAPVLVPAAPGPVAAVPAPRTPKPAVLTGAAPGPSRPTPAEPAPSFSAESLETRIGSRWLLYIGVIAIIVGVSYFEKLAIDNDWIGETARVVQGAVFGLALVYGGLRFVRSGFGLYGQLIAGCGIAVLYVSTYAAFNFYHVVDRMTALLLMCGITAGAAWLADRLRSQGLALAAVGGGFATPFLLPSGADDAIALFGYDAVLIAGTVYLARRREWPAIHLASYAFTALTVAAWAAAFYDRSKYLPTELFLTLFCGMFLYVLHETRHATSRFGRLVHGALWTVPVAYYGSSLAVLFSHAVPLLIFLIALAVAGAIAAVRFSSNLAGLVFVVAVQAPLILWISGHTGRAWLTPALTAVAATYAVNFLAQRHAPEDRPPDDSAIRWLHLSGLAAFAGAYLLVNAVNSAASGPLAFGFALWHAGWAFRVKAANRPLAIHFAALGFTLTAIGVALSFDGEGLTVAWAAEGAAIAWLGLREERPWLRHGGLLLFGVSILRLIVLLFSEPPVNQMVLLNRRAACAAFVVTLTYLLTWAHHRREPKIAAREVGVGLVAGTLLILALAAGEIVAFGQIHGPAPFAPAAPLAIAGCMVAGSISWLGLRRREDWIRIVGAALLSLGGATVLLLQLEPAPADSTVVLNGRAIAGAVTVATLYALAVFRREVGAALPNLAGQLGTLVVAASVLTLTTVSSEITAYWSGPGLAAGRPVSATIDHRFAQQLMISVTWAVYATGSIVAGIRKRYWPIRYFAILVFALTIGKVFLVDLAELDRIYRVLSIVGLGMALLMTSFLYHRFRTRLES